MSAAFETGFFVREPAWHMQGQVLANAPNTEEAYESSGLNWEVGKQQLFWEGVESQKMATDFYAIIRYASNKVLGQCSDRYALFQNSQLFEWCKPLVETDWWAYESAGSLMDGKHCWVLMKQDETEIIPNDTLKKYLLIVGSHTGVHANVITPTTVRVVCMNTLRAALAEKLGVSIVHATGQMNIYRKLQQLHISTTAQFAKQEDYFKRLLDLNMSDTQLEQLADTLFPIKEVEDTTLRSAKSSLRVNSRAKTLLLGEASGAKDLGIVNTGYDAYQAISEFVEHEKGGNRVKDRGWNILFGPGAQTIKKMETVFNVQHEVAV